MKVLLDGRVFSTSAFDRGMGRYVTYILDTLISEGHQVALLLFRNIYLDQHDPLFDSCDIRFANFDPEEHLGSEDIWSKRIHEFTSYLTSLIEGEQFELYIDATPFLGPARFDLFSCPVVAVCYDFIPLKHPDFYLCNSAVRRSYHNGLVRLAHADAVICISKTVQEEIAKFLAVPPSRSAVIVPTIENRYLQAEPQQRSGRYLFALLGGHKSKNPIGSLALFETLITDCRIDVRINIPTLDQRDYLTSSTRVHPAIKMTASISDKDKFDAQRNATVVSHLSIEEGFGIPLLEAIFLERKLLVLDTPINRELLGDLIDDQAAVLFVGLEEPLDIDRFEVFWDSSPDRASFSRTKARFAEHWAQAGSHIRSVIEAASEAYQDWIHGLQIKVFSSVPGHFCGVADYSVSYARSAKGNVAFFFSEGEHESLSMIHNVRAHTYFDFAHFSKRFRSVAGLFNFAFSSALFPGIQLLHHQSRKGDIVLVHERRYFDGLLTMHESTGTLNEFLLGGEYNFREQDRGDLAKRLTFHPRYNRRTARNSTISPVSSEWLKSLGLRYVSHLPPSVLSEMKKLDAREPGVVVNDLTEMEQELDFVPLGIDDRRHPSILRAAQNLRRLRRIQRDDIVIGHFGLILDDLKKLREVSGAIIEYARLKNEEHSDTRRVFFVLVGRIVDQTLFEEIARRFSDAGLSHRLIHNNPTQEIDFDAEIAACDAIACFRIQSRGQLSHVFVRALSLGTPAIVNRLSGYSYDPATDVDDENLTSDLSAVLDRISDPCFRTTIRRNARRHYDQMHRGRESLEAILSLDAQ